jgi:hypothetical protein
MARAVSSFEVLLKSLVAGKAVEEVVDWGQYWDYISGHSMLMRCVLVFNISLHG